MGSFIFDSFELVRFLPFRSNFPTRKQFPLPGDLLFGKNMGKAISDANVVVRLRTIMADATNSSVGIVIVIAEKGGRVSVSIVARSPSFASSQRPARSLTPKSVSLMPKNSNISA